MSADAFLLVDDDPIAAAYVLELLRSRQLLAEWVGCLSEAESRLASAKAYRLIIDRRLPDGDGLNWLHRRPQPYPEPVLLTSGDEIRSDQLPPGVVFLRKPINHVALLTWLESAIAPPPESTAAVPADPSHLPLLHDVAALARLGENAQTLHSLRLMILQELKSASSWSERLADSSAVIQSVHQLHRLTAACTLTGCLRLAQLSAELEARLRSATDLQLPVQAEFTHTLEQTIEQLVAITASS